MLIACPECGGRYSLDEEQDDIETPNVTFWVCVFALGAPLLVLDVATTLALKEPPRPVREQLTTLVHWATLGLLVWNGHIAFAVIWAMAMFCIAIHRTQVREARRTARVAPA